MIIMMKTLKLTQNILYQFLRYSTQKHAPKMQAWQIHAYGDIKELQLTQARFPHINNPKDLLIKVEAASVNPIDVYMMNGYGKNMLNLLRGGDIEFPLTLGRDFSGTIIDKGLDVSNHFNVGDHVYGIIPVHNQGSHAEQVIVNESHVLLRPEHLSAVEATSVLYGAMTAWSALYITGELSLRKPQGAKILILGASGGVGTIAVQILKSQKALVMGTCSVDAIPLVRALGAVNVFDYNASDFKNSVASEGKFDIILDCAKFGHKNIPESWKFNRYITLNSPLLINTDKHGLVGGLATSACDLLGVNMEKCPKGQSIRWGFFNTSQTGLQFINDLLRSRQILPTIHKVYKFEDLPKAYETLSAGHLRGKIVIDMDNSETSTDTKSAFLDNLFLKKLYKYPAAGAVLEQYGKQH